MYAVVIKPDSGYLPTVINENSYHFPDFIMAGYEIISEGTRRECEDVAAEMLQDFKID